MSPEQELSDNIKCPYCGADNAADCEFCGACYKRLRWTRSCAPAQKPGAAQPDCQTGPELPRKEQERPAFRLWLRLAVIGGLTLLYLQWFRQVNYFSFLDFVNLAFHEAGHVFLGFMPRFVMMLGGTIFQLLMPAICLFHLKWRGANLGWQLCLFWLGENLLNISIYAGDAINQALPLVGGGEHDWTYLLTETGLIAHTAGVGKIIFLAGSAIIFLSFYLIGKDALARESVDLGQT